MNWYNLGLAGGIKNISEGAWQLAWEVSKAGTGLDHSNAIFKKAGPDSRLVLYFTPSSQLLAESFGAKPCAKPSPAGLSLVAGSERAWQIHFGRVCGLRRGIEAFHAFQRLLPRKRMSGRGSGDSPLNRHIRELFEQANATPQAGTSMLLALASWAEENLSEGQLHELQPGMDALRRAELEDPASLDALLEETDQQIEQAQSLHDAAWVLLREVADWMPTAR
jgi:hypothetical protein